MAFLSWSLRSNSADALDGRFDESESSAESETENGNKLSHQTEPSPRHGRDDLNPKLRGVILVMGVSSPEKTHFVNQLQSNAVDQAEHLQSASATTFSPLIQIIKLPGFISNPDRDTDILSSIIHLLALLQHLCIPLKGIIYLHPIAQPDFSTADARFLTAFRQICGDAAFCNVILSTTTCGDLTDEESKKRHHEVKTQHWTDILALGAEALHFDGTFAMAHSTIRQLCLKPQITLHLQCEIRRKHNLHRTTVGKAYKSQMEQELCVRKKKIATLKQVLKMSVDDLETERVKCELRELVERQVGQSGALERLVKGGRAYERVRVEVEGGRVWSDEWERCVRERAGEMFRDAMGMRGWIRIG